MPKFEKFLNISIRSMTTVPDDCVDNLYLWSISVVHQNKIPKIEENCSPFVSAIDQITFDNCKSSGVKFVVQRFNERTRSYFPSADFNFMNTWLDWNVRESESVIRETLSNRIERGRFLTLSKMIQ